ncbi:hypothetical protein XA68_11300 [Ophiocordyceps unilateralis]|uniref:Uncharacterized protein n=1 Tax=Ophiocordyceps unilateralis TaxID=268505 RepID=A0A2A9NY16_OPHUN|nr:hypothetical protein XA68_11300 [Ophiocordyceps unilateralis]
MVSLAQKHWDNEPRFKRSATSDRGSAKRHKGNENSSSRSTVARDSTRNRRRDSKHHENRHENKTRTRGVGP